MGESDYDVIIVGGRPAGAALAARLGRRGVKTLIVDRATFPSLPGVPSSPTVHAGTMRLLDELEIPERAYGAEHARMDRFFFEMGSWWKTSLKVPVVDGRDYVYGVDRAAFDHALWTNLARFPSVERREGFAVADVARDEAGAVRGVVGPEGPIHARVVVGADGRFSTIARKVGARAIEEQNACCSTVYYAAWDEVAPWAPGEHGGHVFTTARGLDVLFFAMPDGTWLVNTHQRADRVQVDGDAQRYYDETLRAIPQVMRRLAGARQTSELSGIKKIANGYRTASGPGWVLVGDAVHYKDPVDGQGIYDALVGAKVLDEALAAFQGGTKSWAEAMDAYARGLRAETHPMFLATTKRLKRELYDEPPVPVIKTMIRWMMTDPTYQTQFMSFLARAVPADRWMTAGLVAGAMARGLGRDVRGLFARRA